MEKYQLEQLRQLQRNTSDRDSYQKLTVVLMLYNGFSCRSIADNLGIDPSTVSRYRKQFAQSPDFDTYLATHYKPCQGKLTEAQFEQVRQYVADNLCQAAHQVARFIEHTFSIRYRVNSIRYRVNRVVNLLHRLGFVYKKTSLVPSKADLSAQAAFVKAFGLKPTASA